MTIDGLLAVTVMHGLTILLALFLQRVAFDAQGAAKRLDGQNH